MGNTTIKEINTERFSEPIQMRARMTKEATGDGFHEQDCRGQEFLQDRQEKRGGAGNGSQKKSQQKACRNPENGKAQREPEFFRGKLEEKRPHHIKRPYKYDGISYKDRGCLPQR